MAFTDRLRVLVEMQTRGTGEIRTMRGALSDLDQQAKKTQSGFKQFVPGLTAVGIAFGGLAVAAKGAWNALESGAALQETRGKFDRLAESIGTTGEALRTELGEGIGLLMSQSEQMGLATDLMSLGLAKTSDQAVRLSTVLAELGQDVGQSTLALTNQTTARFDQLNVRVDGFKERLEGLKAAGMDANSAFTEAFLQQAEVQIELVGSKSDTTAGQLETLKSAGKNAYDQLLQDFATVTIARMGDVGTSADVLAVKLSNLATQAIAAWSAVMNAVQGMAGAIQAAQDMKWSLPNTLTGINQSGRLFGQQYLDPLIWGAQNGYDLRFWGGADLMSERNRLARTNASRGTNANYSDIARTQGTTKYARGNPAREFEPYTMFTATDILQGREALDDMNSSIREGRERLYDYQDAAAAASAAIGGGGGGMASSVDEAAAAIANLTAQSGSLFDRLRGQNEFNLGEEYYDALVGAGYSALEVASGGVMAGLFDQARADELVSQTFMVQQLQQMAAAGLSPEAIWGSINSIQGQAGTLAQEFFSTIDQTEAELGINTEKMTTQFDQWVDVVENTAITLDIRLPSMAALETALLDLAEGAAE